MKKLALVLAVVAFAAVSCKKEYTCSCTVTSNVPGATTGTSETTSGKMKKKDAESWCDSGNSSTTSYGYTVESKCALK